MTRRSRNRKQIIAALALLAVVALGSLGLGYAYWSDSITVAGTVNTGELKMGWKSVSTSDNEDGSHNFASCGAQDFTAGSKSLSIKLDQAYPGYTCTITAAVAQYGTVPGTITGIAPRDVDGALDVTPCTNIQNQTVGPDVTCVASVTVKFGASADNSTARKALGFNLDLTFTNYHP